MENRSNKEIGHYTDEIKVLTEEKRNQLGELKSFLRIVAFENGCVIDGPIDPLKIIKAMLHSIDEDPSFSKIISIVHACSKVSPGIARDILLHVAVSGAFADSCECDECVNKRRNRDLEKLKQDISNSLN